MSIYFGDKSWPQLQEAIERDTLIILPVAQVEEHGRHLPVSTDTVIATETARLVAERIKDDIPVLVMPTIWSGYSMKLMTEWPGVIRLQPETMIALVYDVLSSLVEMGFEKIVIINSHGQNPAILELAARKIADQYDVYPAITYVLTMAGEAGPEVRRSELGGCGGHGCEAETAVMLYLSDLVDMSQATDQDTMRYHSRFYPGDMYYTGPKGPRVFWSSWQVQKSKTGLIGDPTLATAETGQALMEAIVQNHVEFITEFYHHTPG